MRPASQLSPEWAAKVSNIVRLLEKYSYEDKVLYIAQECLINMLLDIEGQSRDYREKARRLRKETQTRRLTKEAIRNYNARAQEFDERSKDLQYTKWLLRYVGDGIAWHAYRFSRKHIRALSDKDPVNSLGNPEKFIYHRRLFRAFRHLGENNLPMMHDITNCLRTADLTVFERGRRFRLIEWKLLSPEHKAPKKDTEREKRQVLRLGRIRAYFDTGQIRYLYPHYRRGKHIQVETKERYHFDVISRVMNLARTKASGCENPEEGLYYAAFDTTVKNEREALMDLQRTFPNAFESYFVSKLINPYRDQDQSAFPVTAMDLPAENVMDILNARIGVVILINFKEIEHFCQQAGLPLEIVVESGRKVLFRLSKKSFFRRRTTLLVTPGLWDRILTEFLSVGSFATLLSRMPANNGIIEGRISDLELEPYNPLSPFETVRFRASLMWAEIKAELLVMYKKFH